MKIYFEPYILKFNNTILTSRGAMSHKNGYIISISSLNGLAQGEVSFIENLSIDNLDLIKSLLYEMLQKKEKNDLLTFFQSINVYQTPSLKFAIEMLLLDLDNNSKGLYFKSGFTEGISFIPINGLIWMGPKQKMYQEILDKLNSGFKCLKLKIGALKWEEELALLKFVRNQFTSSELELRVDANGAFNQNNVFNILNQLAELNVHSIEQPIKSGQVDFMSEICSKSPIPIALDEELIGVFEFSQKIKMLEAIKPHFIIIKPSLLGGFKEAESWITLAEDRGIKWWATSALESNIGLNALAQWVATKKNPLYQGLGTGAIYSNNFPSNLKMENGKLFYNSSFHSYI